MIVESIVNLWNKGEDKELSTEELRILQSLKSFFTRWMNTEYPLLSKEQACIEKDVFKKLKRKLKTEGLSMPVEELQHLVIGLAENECKLAMPTIENKSKNLGLTRIEYKAKITDLQNGDDSLIEQAYLAHFEKCVQFLMRRCGGTFENAHEATLNALLEIRKDLIQEKIFYGNLGYYFTNRAKTKLYRIQSKQKLKVSPLEDVDLEDEMSIEKDMEYNQLQSMMAEALSKMCDDCRGILRQYYYEELNFKQIAVKLRKSHDAIRQEARRCRNKLRKLLGESFYKQFPFD